MQADAMWWEISDAGKIENSICQTELWSGPLSMYSTLKILGKHYLPAANWSPSQWMFTIQTITIFIEMVFDKAQLHENWLGRIVNFKKKSLQKSKKFFDRFYNPPDFNNLNILLSLLLSQSSIFMIFSDLFKCISLILSIVFLWFFQVKFLILKSVFSRFLELYFLLNMHHDQDDIDGGRMMFRPQLW